MSRGAGLALAALLCAAPARGQAVAVEGAVLRPKDAPTREVGPGVYLPADLAASSAAELEACRARPAPTPNAATPAAGPVVVGFAAGVVVGIALAVAGAVAFAAATR